MENTSFYAFSTLASGAFFLTDAFPVVLPPEDVYISLVPITWPLEAFRLKYN
jgi:hypothetical protein